MTPANLFRPDAPRLYTIPPSAGFVDALARGLARAFPDPEALAAVTVLLPTRRAGRALGEAFTRLEGAPGAALLPMIRPIGDVDADEPPFEPGELADLAPDAVSAARRRFELARLILQREGAAGRSMGPGGALALADDLARLIDDLATEEVDDLSALSQEVRATLPAHMEEAALFLDIVLEAWPARLAEIGKADPARRRSRLLHALADRWRDTPPDGPVIAAGSTGSIPAAAELLGVVAGLPQGCVVLPGFDREMDEDGWAAIDDSHPQRAMKDLVDRLGVDRGSVAWWPGAEESGKDAPRARLIAEALRPAEATSDWLSRVETLKEGWGGDVFARALSGLSVIEAPGPADEARAAALALRETLETPGARAVLVTPDRALARRVVVEMDRFGVRLDDSAGEPLSDTPPGAFLMRILQAAGDPGSAMAFIALAASPVFALGEPRAKLKPDLGALERAALRGRRPGYDFEALYAAVTDGAGKDERAASRWGDIVRRTASAFQPLMDLGDSAAAKAWAEALALTGEALAASEDGAGADRLWAGDAGEAAAELIGDFLRDAEALPELTLSDFTAAFLEMARSRMVRPRYGAHPRLQILGPLEARLVSADRVILAGLNEGVWPAGGKADPFLSRGMRLAAGLEAPERRFGLAAHDFAQLACGPDVILTRSQKQDGAPTVASRWLWRLQTLARGALGEAESTAALAPATHYLALAAALDDPGSAVSEIAEPMPRPPVEARPRELSVTRIETLIRDPYSIYAEKILGLKALDPPDGEPGPLERGNAYHAAIEVWVETLPEAAGLPHAALERLVAYGRDALLEAGFPEDRLGLELPRFARAARFLVDWEADRRRDPDAAFKTVLTEERGTLTLDAPHGPFTLTAKADRIDLRPDGALDIIDYKTGAPPGKNEVKAGFAPQLPLEAAMAARGGFPSCPSHEPGDLIYLRLSGGKVAGEDKHLVDAPGTEEAVDLAEDALEDLIRLIGWFDDEAFAYRSQPRVKFMNRYGAFDHLARRKEWASAPGDDAGGGES
jgi:ATP-dependent helicase/nuclease subunit B